jgi:hypothetical protein
MTRYGHYEAFLGLLMFLALLLLLETILSGGSTDTIWHYVMSLGL